MSGRLRLAVTADLHWGPHASGNAATTPLRAFSATSPPDVLILAGDMGAEDQFGHCLALFDELPGRKAVVPGNHDIWVTSDDPRGDSLKVYREHLPNVCRPPASIISITDRCVLEASLAVVGSINWYDYSWSLRAAAAAICRRGGSACEASTSAAAATTTPASSAGLWTTCVSPPRWWRRSNASSPMR